VVFEGNAPVDDVARTAARDLSLASVCIQHGWAAETNIGFRNMEFDAFAAWGQGFVELLRPYNPRQRFVVTGDPALDAAATTLHTQNNKGVLFALQTVAPAIPAGAMGQFVELIDDAAEALPDTQILVREHPGHPLARLGFQLRDRPNLVRVDAPAWSLADVLSRATVVASISSTTLLEGAALGRPGLVFEPAGTPPYAPDLVSAGVGLAARTREGAVAALRTLLEPSERQAAHERFRENWFAGLRGDAAGRIAELIGSLA
jgi:hypothetical protein